MKNQIKPRAFCREHVHRRMIIPRDQAAFFTKDAEVSMFLRMAAPAALSISNPAQRFLPRLERLQRQRARARKQVEHPRVLHPPSGC